MAGLLLNKQKTSRTLKYDSIIKEMYSLRKHFDEALSMDDQDANINTQDIVYSNRNFNRNNRYNSVNMVEAENGADDYPHSSQTSQLSDLAPSPISLKAMSRSSRDFFNPGNKRECTCRTIMTYGSLRGKMRKFCTCN